MYKKMDFEIGNILYIVITLVIVIVGLLGKKKKKPAVTGSESGEGSGGGGFLENLEKAFTMGQEDQVVADLGDHEEDLPVEVIEEEPVPLSESGGIWAQYEKLHKPKHELITDFELEGERMIEQFESTDLDEEEGTDYFEVVKDFDAGTAVVYSAIINRIDI